MPTTAQMTAAIASVLEGNGSTLSPVAGIGRVNRYDRFFQDKASFESFHCATESGAPVVNSATIIAGAVRSVDQQPLRRGGGLAAVREHEFEIKLMRGQYDAEGSQDILVDLTVAVLDAFDLTEARDVFSALALEYDTPSAETVGLAGYGNPAFIVVNQAIITLVLREMLG